MDNSLSSPHNVAELPINQRTYHSLRDMLVSVAIQPSAKLNEAHLADQLGVGRASIRDAFKWLAEDQLVAIYPRQGTYATQITISDAGWLAEVRRPLEATAAGLAASRRSAADIDQINDYLYQLEWLSTNLPNTDLDQVIHRFIYQMTNNHYLQRTLNHYLNLAMRVWYYCINRLPSVKWHVSFQKPILRSIQDGDTEEAERLGALHVHEFMDDVRRSL